MTHTRIFRSSLKEYLELGGGYQWKHTNSQDYQIETKIIGDDVYHIVTYFEYAK